MGGIGACARLALAILLVAGVPDRVFAQDGPECETGDCRRASDDLAESGNRIRQARSDFVLALRRLLEALPGAYGDEGPAIRGAVAALSEALGRWDRAIRAYQAPLAAVTGNADVHVALGTLQFERGRPQLAASEWAVASRLAPERSDVFLLLGLAYDATGRHAEAAKALERSSMLAPRNPAALYGLAQQQLRIGQSARAAETLTVFHQRFEGASPAAAGQRPFLRGGLLREAAGVAPIFPPAAYATGFDALASGEYGRAVAAFEQAAARDPLGRARQGAGGAAVTAGSAALRAGNLQTALAQFETAVRASPDWSEARRLLAFAQLTDDRHREAVEQLQAAVRLDPADERSRVALARALVSVGRPLDAEQALGETVTAIPRSAQAQFELGRLYQSLERREAADALMAAAAFTPLVGQERLYELIGRLRLANADFDSGIDAFRRRIDASPNHGEAHRTLGETYLQLGRHDEALAEFAAALLIDPTDSQSHAGRAQIHLRGGRYQEAAASARAALQLDANHQGALYALGTSLLRLGQADSGAAAIERFHALQTAARARDERAWNLKLLRQTAWMHADRGEYDEAVARLREAAAIEPTADSYLSLGVVLKRAGRQPEALDALERAAGLQAGPEVHAHLAEVYTALGRPDDSRRQLALLARAKDERFRTGASR